MSMILDYSSAFQRPYSAYRLHAWQEQENGEVMRIGRIACGEKAINDLAEHYYQRGFTVAVEPLNRIVWR
jgi:hypothetical protein